MEQSRTTPRHVKKKKTNDLKHRDSEEDHEEQKLTLAAVDAMSSDSENGDGGEEWNAEAQALRQAIAEGAFDHLMKKPNSGEDINIEEVSLNDDNDESSDDQNEEQDGSESEVSGDDGNVATSAGKALVAVTEDLVSSRQCTAWAETFDVTTTDNPLPFDAKRGGNPLDVHDDLKRELAFYNVALDAVEEARRNCLEAKIPFSRPDDFFAEMVKTDDHMAKIKDRLIFENKKMDAFAQRKANQEHKLRAREAHAHKLEEKAKRKRQHFKDLEDWQDSRNTKRIAADKKYGYGGKRGRFKQNSQNDVNDMSGFRPKGSGNAGTKRTRNKRPGKRARDAARSKG